MHLVSSLASRPAVGLAGKLTSMPRFQGSISDTFLPVPRFGDGTPEQNKAFFKALKHEDVDAMKIALSAGADIYAHDAGFIMSPVNFIVLANKVKMLQALLPLKRYEMNLEAMLIFAAVDSKPEILEELVKVEELDVNAKDEYGNTALIWASRQGDLKSVEVLLNVNGINVNVENKNGRALDEVEHKLLLLKDTNLEKRENYLKIKAALERHGATSSKKQDNPPQIQNFYKKINNNKPPRPQSNDKKTSSAETWTTSRSQRAFWPWLLNIFF